MAVVEQVIEEPDDLLVSKAELDLNRYYEESLSPSLVDSREFCAFVGITTLLNAVFLGLEVDFSCWKCKDEQERFGLFVFADVLFTCLFIAEVMFRIFFYGPQGYPLLNAASFFKGGIRPEQRCYSMMFFNVLDLILAFIRGAWLLHYMDSDMRIKVVSAFRVYHLARVVKTFSHIDAFKELWLVLSGVADVLITISCVFVLLILMAWSLAIFLTTVIKKEGDGKFDYSRSSWSQDDYWGSVLKSMFTLFQVLTRDKWYSQVVRPLVEVHPIYIIVFVAFLAVGVVGLLNIIVAVVVESTLQAGELNVEAKAKRKKAKDEKTMQSLKNIFLEADTDGDAMLSLDELQDPIILKQVRGRLKALEIYPIDLVQLFALLDEDGMGAVPIDKFFRGCSRLRGKAMAIDIHNLSCDMVRSNKSADRLISLAEDTNSSLTELVDLLDTVDTDIIQSEHDVMDPVLQARRERHIHERLEKKVKRTGSSDLSRDSDKDPKERRNSIGSDSNYSMALMHKGNNPQPGHRLARKNSLTQAALQDVKFFPPGMELDAYNGDNQDRANRRSSSKSSAGSRASSVSKQGRVRDSRISEYMIQDLNR